MNTEIIWDITSLDCYPIKDNLKDVVFCVHWYLTATNGDYSASAYGQQNIFTKDISTFIPYKDLQKDQVIGWLKESIGQEKIHEYELNLTEKIKEKQNPKIISFDLPWTVKGAK
jgi:hypothetical protein